MQTFQSSYKSINIVIGSILPRDASWSINQVFIKEVNHILKAKCSKSLFIYIGYDSCWIFANGSLNADLFFSDNVHLAEKGNLKLTEAIFSSIKNCNSVTCNKQFLISYKIAVSFKLNNFCSPPLSFSAVSNPVSSVPAVNMFVQLRFAQVNLPVQVMLIPVNLFVLVMIVKVNPFVLEIFVFTIHGLL